MKATSSSGDATDFVQVQDCVDGTLSDIKRREMRQKIVSHEKAHKHKIVDDPFQTVATWQHRRSISDGLRTTNSARSLRTSFFFPVPHRAQPNRGIEMGYAHTRMCVHQIVASNTMHGQDMKETKGACGGKRSACVAYHTTRSPLLTAPCQGT